MTPEIRLGAVSYLNARPLVYDLDACHRFALRFDVPSRCADLLHGGAIDVGLIPSIEYMRRTVGADEYAIVPDLADVFHQRLQDRQNIVRADVTTATELSVERLADIQRSLAAATGRTVDLTSRVDPSIVGGMVARIGSTVFDGSIVSHLKRIRQRLDASI